MLSGSDQARIQLELASASPQERREGMNEAHEALEKIGLIMIDQGSLGPVEARLAEMLTEYICRAECIETGKGAIYRAWRRVQLTRRYLKK